VASHEPLLATFQHSGNRLRRSVELHLGDERTASVREEVLSITGTALPFNHMANLCDSRLSFTGHPKLLDQLVAELAGFDDDGNPIILDLSRLVELPSGLDRDELRGACALLWGTRQNVFDVTCERPTPELLVYTAVSAWKAPERAVESFARRRPELQIELVWEESGEAEVGFARFVDGVCTESDSLSGDLAEGAAFLEELGWSTHAECWRSLAEDDFDYDGA
jgi:hypothetical protein